MRLFFLALGFLLQAAVEATCPCPGFCSGSSPALPAGEGPPPGPLWVSKTAEAHANCTTIQGAIDLTRYAYRNRYTIYIAPGIYKEKVTIHADAPPITLVGLNNGIEDAVTIWWNDQDGAVTPTDPRGEWDDQTLWVGGDDFIAMNLTLANPGHDHYGSGRNMAAQVLGDRAQFYDVRFYGSNSDTLFHGRAFDRAYFENCYINGSYDFIWGLGSAWFQSCTIVGSDNILAHKGSTVDINYVNNSCSAFAFARHPFSTSCTAVVIADSRIIRPSGYTGHATTLGRCWRPQATNLYKNSWLDSHISPGGWREARMAAVTLFAECNNTGPGAAAATGNKRVKGALELSAAEAAAFSIQSVLRGWIPTKDGLPRLTAEIADRGETGFIV